MVIFPFPENILHGVVGILPVDGGEAELADFGCNVGLRGCPCGECGVGHVVGVA